MILNSFIDKFFYNSHVEIGDGLFYVHTDKTSEIVACDNKNVLSLSENEYCIKQKNSIFTIYNKANKQIFFINLTKEKIASYDFVDNTYSIGSSVFILDGFDLLAFIDYDKDCINLVNYRGDCVKTLHSFETQSIRSIQQLYENIIVVNYGLWNHPYFDSDKFNKSIVYDIANDKYILKDMTDETDDSIITNVSLFYLPCDIPNYRRNSWETNKKDIHKIPVIKCSIITPLCDYNDQLEYNSSIIFCDLFGNLVKKTTYSDIVPVFDYYLTKHHFPSTSWESYGLLDQNFDVILPCKFSELSIERDKICIPQPDWGDTKSIILDLASKRFELQKISGEKILLPLNYSRCIFNAFKNNPQLLTAYTVSDNGEAVCGIINTNGDIILPARYSSICLICDNLYIAYLLDTDNYTEPLQQILYIADNIVKLCKTYLKVETPDSFDRKETFLRTRLYCPEKDSKVAFGIINMSGEEIVPSSYDYVAFPNEGKMCYVNNGRPGWYDILNDCSHEFNKFSFIKSFNHNCAVACTGKIQIRTQSLHRRETGGWDEASDSPCYGDVLEDDINGNLFVTFGNSHLEGIIDEFGKTLIEPKYQSIIPLPELNDSFIAKINDKFGCINLANEVVVPFEYDWFSDELYDLSDDNNDLSDVIFLMGTSTEVTGFNSELEVVLNMDSRLFSNKFRDNDYYEDNYDYERDTYYALGGSDYDEWRNNGGNLDDMMDGLGL